jgi:hypothetical protein
LQTGQNICLSKTTPKFEPKNRLTNFENPQLVAFGTLPGIFLGILNMAGGSTLPKACCLDRNPGRLDQALISYRPPKSKIFSKLFVFFESA